MKGTFLIALVLAATAARVNAEDVKRPFLLWTPAEATALRQRLETDPLAKKQYDLMVTHAVSLRRASVNMTLLNLFKYAVLKDRQAGETEKKALLAFVGKHPPANIPGNPNTNNAQWRDDRTLEALRMDVLQDLLSDQEKADIRKTLEGYVKWLEDCPDGPWRKSDRGLAGRGARTGWLPNMQWPTVIGVHDLAVATGDETLIRRCFEATGGWKWFFDNYLAGDGFYMEEFGKYYSNIGAMLFWCEGLERLGLSKYGYGYTGRNGANMERFLNMLMRVGYPRIDSPPGGTPTYAIVNMGDASPCNILNGYNPDGTGGSAFWYGGRMNGPELKLAQPLWWEIGKRRFPNAGYDYFLAQLRKPGEAIYLPTLYFGLGPVDPNAVKPPPAPSLATPDRGFALLRAEESPAYWESPKPAVSLQFGMYYVHYVHDCFSILQYVAHNRYIYNKMGATQGNYAGGDRWRDHVRGQAGGVGVDGLKPQPIDDGENGIRNERLRHRFDPDAKFVAIRAKPVDAEVQAKDGTVSKVRKAIYPDVDLERALVLTDAYLLDLFNLVSDRPRRYDWHVTSPATRKPAAGWAPLHHVADKDNVSTLDFLADLQGVDAGVKPWRATLQQSQLPGGIGVNVRMLGAENTTLACGKPPIGAAETGVTLVASRQAPRTLFAALHEPFAGNKGRVERFESVGQTDQGLAVRIAGAGIDDRVLVGLGEDAGKSQTLAGGGESFTFAGYAFIRLDPDKVHVSGDLQAMKLRVTGKPALVVNGQPQRASVADGVLSYAP